MDLRRRYAGGYLRGEEAKLARTAMIVIKMVSDRLSGRWRDRQRPIAAVISAARFCWSQFWNDRLHSARAVGPG
jgi:hypothetical protein